MDILTLIGITAAIVGIIAGVIQVLDYLQKRREKTVGAAPETRASQQQHLTQLRQILTSRFDEGELKTLCFDLGVDYDILPGDDKADKARELIEYLERRGRIPNLVITGKQLRPDIAWDVTLETLPQQQISHNLPPRTEFIGRESVKSELHQALRSRSRLVSIDGIGGIGKTALALEVAYECLNASQEENRTDSIANFDGFIWATAKDRELDLDDLIDAIARTLNYPGISQRSPEEKESAARKLLRARPYLLIVDNLEAITDEHVHSFLSKLPEPSKALITTRKRLSLDARMFSLEDLNETEALALMRSEGKRLGLASVDRAGDPVLLRLYQSTGGAPLAIKWAVGQIRQKGQSLETVLKALSKAESRIFERIFVHSWELLSQDAQRVIVVMPLFATLATRAAIEAASGVHDDALDQALGQLVEMSLLDATDELELAQRRYSVHPLTRAYATAKHKSNAAFVQDAFERTVSYYRRLVTPPSDVWVGIPYWCGLFNHAGVRNLQEEWPNLAHLIRRALDQSDDTKALDLFIPLVHLLNAWGLQNERLQLSYEICESADRPKDQVDAWLWIDAIGFILSERRELAKLEHALGEGRKTAHRFEMTDALVLADALEAWTYIPASHRNLEIARTKIDSALLNIDLDSVLTCSSKVHKIVVSRAVGAKAMLRQLEEGFKDEEKLRKLELQLRGSAGESVARPLLRLVRFYLKHGEIQLAEEHPAQVEHPRPRDLANLNYTRALIAEKKGELQEAIHLAERALEQNGRFGSGRGERKYQRLLERLSRKTTASTNYDKPKDENQANEE